ncbi:TPA: hypothetical protein J1Y50_003880 [Escherichia coli]|nr:hypothetical protein [Escherichia coli]HAZ3502670.1 hypothetical protein [Escherichia coli]HAZ3608079.1 hypothetical protein [Escherichia coli]HAZ3651286.1 hypothetical protein [Escherichia coli]HAZ3678688.1 hypothetical protein [Escherichia coli]
MSLSEIQDTLSGVSSYAWMFSVVSITLVFIGWYVTYNNALKVATRSESKAIIDAVAKILNEISDIAIDYWVNKSTPPDFNPFKKKELKSFVGGVTPSAKLYLTAIHAKSIQINKYMEFLRARNLAISDSYFTQVLIKATIDCEKSYQFNKSYRVIRAQDVTSASTEFMMHLYESFQKSHPPRIPINIFRKIKSINDEIDAWHQSLYN